MNQLIIPSQSEDNTGRVYKNSMTGAFVVQIKFKCGHQSATTWADEPTIIQVGEAIQLAKVGYCPLGPDCKGPQ